MLRCSGGRIYTGYAVDVQARYQQHCTGKGARFTKAFPPECILKTFELESKELALRLEARIKKLDKSQKERLAKEGSTGGSEGGSASSPTLLTELMAGLSEPLKKKRKKKSRP